MPAQKHYHYKQHFDEDGVIFTFSGFISEEILFALGDVLKKKLVLETNDPNRVKQVFSVFVELVQNIIHHSANGINNRDAPDRLCSGLVTVGSRDDRFYVGCGNIISSLNAARLQERLEAIRELNREELRSRYRKIMREKGEPYSSGGASLGLIEVARRSSAPIEFDFFEINSNRFFYFIKSYI